MSGEGHRQIKGKRRAKGVGDQGAFVQNSVFLSETYRKYMLPSVLSVMAANVAGVIDTMIAGQYLGEEGLAAMALVSPVYLIYYTIGAVIGMGGANAGNMAIGRGDYTGYRRIFSFSFWLLLGFSLLMTVTGLIFLPGLIHFLGGTGVVAELSAEYLRWYIILGSCTLMVYIPLYFLRIQGMPKVSAVLFMLTSGLNVFFSWLFMSPLLHMGIAGASVGTGMAMGISAIIGFYYLLKKSRDTRFEKIGGDASQCLKEILFLGSPGGFNNLLQALRNVILNKTVLSLGVDAVLPAVAVLKSMSDLLSGMVIGVASAMMPIIGVFYGERDYNGIRRTARTAIKSGFWVTMPFVFLAAVLARPLAYVHNIRQPETVEAVIFALVFLSISMVAAYFSLMAFGYFNAIRRPFISNLTLFLRLFAVFSIVERIAAKIGGFKGICVGLVVVECISLLVLAGVLLFIKHRNPGMDFYLLDSRLEPEDEISFSVVNTAEAVSDSAQRVQEFLDSQNISPKTSMRTALALEEMLALGIEKGKKSAKPQYADVRITREGEDSLILRIRSAGEIFDPISWYKDYQTMDAGEIPEELLGVHVVIKSAKSVEFRVTFGTNTMIITF